MEFEEYNVFINKTICEENVKREIIKKQKIIDEIAKKLEGRRFTKKTIETVFDAMLNVIPDILSDDAVKKLKEEKVILKLRLDGVGAFYIKKLLPRKYCVPSESEFGATSHLVEKQESHSVGFRIANDLKRKLNKKEVS